MTHLNPADAAFEAKLRAALPASAFRPYSPHYGEDPRGRVQGVEGLVVAPDCTEDVATAVRLANEARVGVIPFGGGTGLVLGQVMPEGARPLVLSLERMTRIRGVYPKENVIVVDAGAILADVQAAAEGENRLFPLSLAAEGSCRIGGNLATNAGGVNVLRYGNARELCLGLEAVLPDGTIWNGLKRLRKDNTGYDLRNLLCGAEGTLCVITGAALRLFPRPARNGAAVIVVPDPRAALDLLELAGQIIGTGISAFELISGVGLEFLKQTLPDRRRPFDATPAWMVLIDLGLSEGQDETALLESLFEAAFEAGMALDGVIAQSEQQRQDFWLMRESIPEANRLIGSIASHDISVPIGSIPEFIAEGYTRLAAHGDYRVNCFGHLGDGNLHFNVFPAAGRTRADYPGAGPQVKQVVHDLVHEMEGSVSAEHGLGRYKAEDLQRYGDPAKLAAMRAIKSALDPNGIMNPGAVLPLAD